MSAMPGTGWEWHWPQVLGDIDSGGSGLGIGGRQDFMNIAVAAFASCGFGVAGSQRFPVNAGVVGLLLVSMAGGTGWFGEIGIVRKSF